LRIILAVVFFAICLLSQPGAFAAETNEIEVFVDGKPLLSVIPAQVIGDTLLLPAEPIAQALGDTLSVDATNRIFTIYRSQDASTVQYSIASGDFTINSVPSGNVRTIIPLSTLSGQILMPPDLIAALMGVSVRSQFRRVDVLSGVIASPTVKRPTRCYKDAGIDFVYGEGAGSLVALNPATNGGVRAQPQWVRESLIGTGAHWGPLDIVGKTRLLAGTGGRFLTFNAANLNVEHLNRKWILAGGDNPLKFFTSRQLVGYPGRGAQVNVPLGRWNVSNFSGVGFSQGIPVGGGAVRLSYERLLNITEASYRFTPNLKTAVAGVFFKDPKPFILDTEQHFYGADWVTNYKSRKFSLMSEIMVGNSRRTPTLAGSAYLMDYVWRYSPTRWISFYGEYDRVSPNFAHPQLANAFTDRQDVLIGCNGSLTRRIRYDVSGTFNKTALENPRPAKQEVLNASVNVSTFTNGPQILVVGNQTFFDPGSGVDLTTEAGEPGRSTLGTVGIDGKLAGAQILATDTVTVQSTRSTDPVISNSFNLSASKYFPRIGSLQFLTQIGTIVSDQVQKTFDIRCLYITKPIFKRYSLTFGPGYSRAGEFKRFTFNAGLSSNLPYVGSYNMSVNRSLSLTQSQGRLNKTVYFNKARARSEFDFDRTGKIPPFGSVSGYVLSTADFPAVNLKGVSRAQGIFITLDDQPGIFRASDKDGKWSFDNIPVGRHKVGILLTKTPANLAIVSKQAYYVDVLPGQNTPVNFAVAEMASLKGALKTNADAGVSKDSLCNVRVYAEPGDSDVLTSYDGSFIFTDMAPGRYKIKVDPAFLPVGTEAIPQELEVKLEPGRCLENAEFTIKLKERAVQKKKF